MKAKCKPKTDWSGDHVRMWRITKACFLCLLIGWATLNTQAHGDIHEQIIKVSQQIKAAPDSMELYLKRGQLYHQHGEFRRAKADFKRVRKKSFFFKIVDLELARLLLDRNRPRKALRYVNNFLSHEAEHLQAILTRAKIYTQLHQHHAATEDYEQAIAIAQSPKPEYYLDLAASILQTDPNAYSQAVEALQRGETALGFIITLQQELVNLAIAHRQYEDALTWIQHILKKIPRQEQWLARKAEVLEQMGDNQQATIFYKKALQAIHQLPDRHKKTDRMKTLQQKINQRLQALNNLKN